MYCLLLLELVGRVLYINFAYYLLNLMCVFFWQTIESTINMWRLINRAVDALARILLGEKKVSCFLFSFLFAKLRSCKKLQKLT